MPHPIGLVTRPAAASGGGAWTPTSVSGLAAWYDASNAGSITQSGGLVSQWNDLSGNGLHLTQGTGGNQPTTGTDTVNSLNAIKFPNTDDTYMNFPSNPLTGASAGSLFMVVSPVGWGRFPVGGMGSTDDDWYPYLDGDAYVGFGKTDRPDLGSVGGQNGLAFAHVSTFIVASGDYRWYVDGSSRYSSGSSTVGWGSAPHMGGLGTTGGYFGDICEVFMYNSALGSTDQTAAQNYLKTKWGTA